MSVAINNVINPVMYSVTEDVINSVSMLEKDVIRFVLSRTTKEPLSHYVSCERGRYDDKGHKNLLCSH